MNKNLRRTTLLWPLLILLIAVSAGSGAAPAEQAGIEDSSVQEIVTPRVDDPISDAELRDLQTIATQKDIPLQAAIDRYAWNDNFALAVASIRKTFPEAFAGAEIVDDHNAWVAFKGRAPEGARDMIDVFSNSHSDVAVGVHTDMGFAEVELQRAIEKVHFAVLKRPEVRDAATSHDYATDKITTTVSHVCNSRGSRAVIECRRETRVPSNEDPCD